jgi:hypothetical protein
MLTTNMVVRAYVFACADDVRLHSITYQMFVSATQEGKARQGRTRAILRCGIQCIQA